jgi:hypothetical protein
VVDKPQPGGAVMMLQKPPQRGLKIGIKALRKWGKTNVSLVLISDASLLLVATGLGGLLRLLWLPAALLVLIPLLVVLVVPVLPVPVVTAAPGSRSAAAVGMAVTVAKLPVLKHRTNAE